MMNEILNADMIPKGLVKIEYMQNGRREYFIVEYNGKLYSTSFIKENDGNSELAVQDMLNNLTLINESELKEENEVFYAISYGDSECDSFVLEEDERYRELIIYNSKTYEYIEEYDETTRKLDRNTNKI